MKKNRQVVN